MYIFVYSYIRLYVFLSDSDGLGWWVFVGGVFASRAVKNAQGVVYRDISSVLLYLGESGGEKGEKARETCKNQAWWGKDVKYTFP